MKLLSFFLILTVGLALGAPVRATETRFNSLVTRPDSIPPTNRVVVHRKKVEPTAVLAFLASIGAIVGGIQSLQASVFFTLIGLSVVLAVIALIRIGRSKGRSGGTALAALSIAIAVFCLSIVALLTFGLG